MPGQRIATSLNKRCKVLLGRYTNDLHRMILFSDENIFTIEEIAKMTVCTHRSPGSQYSGKSFGPKWRGLNPKEHTLTWKASNNLWPEQLTAYLKKCCVLLMNGDGD
ncbi:unnamed protein product [Nezara viridula]|uniref:Uncharacterized protein n=1 Tax=Nezara viridula TaxID=85310 RepID=A0A9P0GYQ7_NEZVI|nr:unnamed protein product [Nezara viridula]